jgi:hypothetical protein
MYTIRRHLGRGPQKGHFQIRGYVKDYKQGDLVEYVNPETHTIIFTGCRLYNSTKTAQRILNGADKERCAWIIAESYIVVPRQALPMGEELTYNPKISVNWELNGQNADNMTFKAIQTIGTKLFTIK